MQLLSILIIHIPILLGKAENRAEYSERHINKLQRDFEALEGSFILISYQAHFSSSFYY
jgi:hypothetical protein